MLEDKCLSLVVFREIGSWVPRLKVALNWVHSHQVEASENRGPPKKVP